MAHYIEGARVLAIDISPGALKVARENIARYELGDRVKVMEGDLLTPLIWLNKDNVDIVVSNPPYIDQEGMANLSPEVRMEPELALSGGIDGLDYYRRLIPQALKVLKDDGLLALEIGYDQAAAVRELFDASWSKVEVKKDYSGHDRMVFAWK